MRALIFEPQFAGHNLVYVRHMVQALSALGVEVTLQTSRQATESEEYAKHLGALHGSFDVLASELFELSKSGCVRVNGPAGLFASLRSILDGLKTAKPDHFFLPFGNPLAHALGLPNPVSRHLRKEGIEAEIILLFGKYAYRHRDLASKAKQELALQLLANGPWTRIHHIVPHAVEVMHSHSARLRSCARLLADPVDPPPKMSKSQARELLGLDSSWTVLSLVGLIDQRKGVSDLLAAAQQLADSAPPELKILLAGKNSSEARQLLAGPYRRLIDAGRILVLDRHLRQTELWAACVASDLITTPYPNHRYSASILIRAASARVPVLANSIGWMEDVTRRFGLGWTCDTRDPGVFSATIQEVIGQLQGYAPSPPSKGFVDFHTLANFQQQVTCRMQERLRLGDHFLDRKPAYSA
jgi:glycosyltransferase involved in cell wall biosynthesis